MKVRRLIPSRRVRRWAWTAALAGLLVLYPLSVFRAVHVERESGSPTSRTWSCVWVGVGSIGGYTRIVHGSLLFPSMRPWVAWDGGFGAPHEKSVTGWVEYQMHAEYAVHVLHGWIDASVARRGAGEVSYRLAVPLWMPLLVVAVGTLFSWRRFFHDRRQVRRGMCAACGYFVGGLAKGVPCPECGRPRPAPGV